jgi:hypothetical protein
VDIAHSKNPAANSREGNYAAMMLVRQAAKWAGASSVLARH